MRRFDFIQSALGFRDFGCGRSHLLGRGLFALHLALHPLFGFLRCPHRASCVIDRHACFGSFQPTNG